MRRAIEDARTEIPPPSLKQIARGLGYTAEGALRETYPEMCTAHKQWRKDWLEQRRHTLRLAIRQWVAAEPTPTNAAVCIHFGISHSYFPLHCPEEYAEVLRRSTERARTTREDRALSIRKEVLSIVRNLREQDLYPSLARVRAALSPGFEGCAAVLRASIDEAISHFGPVVRARNELGRFV
jgi:hypothetical protein